MNIDNTFGIPIIPDNEDERLAKLHSLHILDTYEENGTFKHIASRMFNVPIALVNFVDKDYVFTKASVGVGVSNQVSRGVSLCSLAVLRTEVTVFENARVEPCLLANPMVTGDFGLQFYAAAPLTTSDGFNIGAVCIVDKVPREFSASDQKMLQGLASIVMEDIEKA